MDKPSRVASPVSSRRTWIILASVAVAIVVIGVIALLYGDKIATFVTYKGGTPPGSATVVVIACNDQNQTGSCEQERGRLGDVSLELTLASGTVLNGTTDNNGVYRFEQVEFGNHSLFATLPFPGFVTGENPQDVLIPAPSGSSGQIEITVFVPVSLTGESSMTADIEYRNPQQKGGVLGDPTAFVEEKVGTVYPGQMLDVLVKIASTTPLSEATEFKVIDDYDDACVDDAYEIFPGATNDGSKITWNLKTEGGKYQYSRVLRYTMRLKTALPEISPLLCTNRVTIVDSSGATIGTTTGSLQVVDLPNDRAVLEVTKSVEDLNGGAVKAGDEIRYTIGITNIGLVAEKDAVLHDDIIPLLAGLDVEFAPSGVDIQVTKAGGAHNKGFVEISGLQVPVTREVGEQVTITLTATVLDSAETFDRLDNYVTVTGTNGAYAEDLQTIKIGQVPYLLKAN